MANSSPQIDSPGIIILVSVSVRKSTFSSTKTLRFREWSGHAPYPNAILMWLVPHPMRFSRYSANASVSPSHSGGISDEKGIPGGFLATHAEA